jgi:hypothetical protein
VTSGRDLYAAERDRQLRAQARQAPADPQRAGPGDPRDRVAAMMLPCATWGAGWQVCQHPELVHEETETGTVIWCSIATAAGRCGCERYRPGRLHDFGPDGVELECRRCGLYLLDIAGLCEPVA